MASISICIPAYSMGGKGASYLSDSLEILTRQSFDDFEVVVSDQSSDTAVQDVCDQFKSQFSIRHLWNLEGKRQASANTNNAIKHAQGEVIKILFQDDYLGTDDVLKKTSQAFDTSGKWLLCGSGVSRDGVTIERPMVPRLTQKLRFGKNTVSSPSVLAMHRSGLQLFDEELIWLMDVDLYQRLWDRHGEPLILPETQVVNRIHDGQVSVSVTPELRRKELRYMAEKAKSNFPLSARLEYWRQLLKAR